MAGGPGSYVLGAEERKEVLDVLDGGNLFRYGTPGVDGFQAKVVTFENEMAERLGHKHVVATSSGTGSLMCCLAALGIGIVVRDDPAVRGLKRGHDGPPPSGKPYGMGCGARRKGRAHRHCAA